MFINLVNIVGGEKMDLLAMTLAELKQGWHVETDDYCCNYCNYRCQLLSDIQQHVADQHQGADLVHDTTRYNTLTDKQQRLFTLFAAGKRDKEIAEELQLSPSTIRHQKFTFRERAKQAKYYLATFEKTFFADSSADRLLPIPPTTEIIDDRFAITEAEYAAITKKYFKFTTGTLQLNQWPNGEKKIVAILHRIIEEVARDYRYSEAEIDQLIQPIYFDYAIIRRYLVDYGFMARTSDGTQYWRIF